jgi:Tol biopolymer transport system component/DNA-binding winged helix-turn-helix (wHTH) protein
VEASGPSARSVHFGVFEVDLRAGELRKSGAKLKFSGQPFQVLAILLERPGEVVTREELQKRLWADGTFVDFDHNLNAAINKIREVLGDSAERPRFVETLARRGYRFIYPVAAASSPPMHGDADIAATAVGVAGGPSLQARRRWPLLVATLLGLGILAAGAILVYQRLHQPSPPPSRALTRLTFDAGLQFGATWSPDGRFIAYSADKGGKFDIWVEPVSGGEAVQVTHGPGHNWQPDWSPDGKQIAFRSERGGGGLYAVPALGGNETRIASFGYFPRWSPDGSQLLFRTSLGLANLTGHSMVATRLYVVSPDGSPPREVLAGFNARHNFAAKSAAWHPDGRRITVWFGRLMEPASPDFWTVPVAGGSGVESEPAGEARGQLEKLARGRTAWATWDTGFSWEPSGTAIYFERTFGGARNLWKMTIDRETLRATAIERLTTGPGPDTDLALSPDGKKLAFTSRVQHTRIWLFPFDATNGRITGAGEAVTPPGLGAWLQNLSRDGQKMAFIVVGGGRQELWEKSLVDGREATLAAGNYFIMHPVWSPDGSRLAYLRDMVNSRKSQLFVWSAESRTEEALTASSTARCPPFDWSPDGKSLLVTQERDDAPWVPGIWLLPLDAAPLAETRARKVASRPAGYSGLWQGHFSPDGRWIVFEAARSQATGLESALYVIPTSGGAWIPITDGKGWADKPRWSPDGNTIYYVSSRSGFFNVWGVRFDPAEGRPVGEPFQVTNFDNPCLRVPEEISPVELSLTQNRLTLTMAEISGSLWMLDNVDR